MLCRRRSSRVPRCVFRPERRAGNCSQGRGWVSAAPLCLFPVVPRLFHGARRANTFYLYRVPIVPIVPGCEKGIQENGGNSAIVGNGEHREHVESICRNLGTDWEQDWEHREQLILPP